MLDVFGHFTSLDILRARLKQEILSTSLTDPNATVALKALEASYPFAVFGSVVDHLLAHAGPSDTEVLRLQQAHSIYIETRDFIQDLRNARDKFEKVAQQPVASTALSDYNAARASLASLAARYDPLVAKLQTFVWSLRPLRHLTHHPVAQDQPVKVWPWRDIVLSRRTGAFAAEVMQLGRKFGTSEALAFSIGVLASYIGNAIGSPYLLHGVGGPRRSHPYRDRLASYAVGSWMRHAPPAVPLDFDPLRFLPVFGSPNSPALPSWLAELLQKALVNTYSGGVSSALPDLDAAYTQFLEHWRLLHSFPPLLPARPIEDTLDVKIANTLTPKDLGPHDNPPPQPGPAPGGGSGKNIFDPGPGAPPWFQEQHEGWLDYVEEGCFDVLFLPLLLVRVAFWLGHKAGDDEPVDPSPGVYKASTARLQLSQPLTQSEFDAVTGGKDILIAVHTLYQMDSCLHHLMNTCLKVLKVVGLIYPEAAELPDPTFRQFVILPPANLGLQWPARPPANANRFLRLPTSPVEKPGVVASEFAPGEKPIAFLVKGIGGGSTIFDTGFDILREELLDLPSSPVRTSNLNLDADRGEKGECWTPNPGTSINDDPVSPVVLGYGDV
jgi:hypothetical protein